jgi:two-component SAPR family response regulator
MAKRILIVEDDAIMAMDLMGELEKHGFAVLGPCATTECALELFTEDGCDAAILDVNLGTETSERVAEALNKQGVPFVVVSGYNAEQYPAIYNKAPYLSKPVQTDSLLRLLPSNA